MGRKAPLVPIGVVSWYSPRTPGSGKKQATSTTVPNVAVRVPPRLYCSSASCTPRRLQQKRRLSKLNVCSFKSVERNVQSSQRYLHAGGTNGNGCAARGTYFKKLTSVQTCQAIDAKNRTDQPSVTFARPHKRGVEVAELAEQNVKVPYEVRYEASEIM